MDNRTIFTKTAKGLGEAVGKTRALPRDFRNILKEIDGKASVEELQGKLGSSVSEARLQDALTTLLNGDYIREFASPAVVADVDLDFAGPANRDDAPIEVTMDAFLRELSSSANGDKPDLASTEQPGEIDTAEQEALIDEILREEQAARAKEDAQRKAKAVAEAQAKKSAEEQARRKATEASRLEAQARAKKEAEEQARKQVAEQARREEEEKAKREAEAQAKKDAEEKARKEAAERAHREAEEKAEKKARLEAEAQAKKDAEEQARQKAEEKAEEKARREAEQQARKVAEEKARLEAEAQAKLEAEERVKQEAEEKARRKAAVAQIRREAIEKFKRDGEERARKEAEEKFRLEAEAKARKEAEEQARRDAEEQARRDAEEQAQREADERARLKAEAQIRQEAEKQARWEAEEEARLAAEAQAKQQAEREARERSRLEAEAKAKEEAEERARRIANEKEARIKREAARQAEWDAKRQAEQEAREKARLAEEALAKQEAEAAEEEAKKQRAEAEEEQAKQQAARDIEQEVAYQAGQAAIFSNPDKHYRKPAKWRKYAVPLLLFLAVVGAVGVPVIPFDGQARLFEKAAAAQFQQPVKIDQVHLALIPQPHWRLEGVSIGENAQIEVAQIDATAELDTLFSDKIVFKAIKLTSPVLTEEGLGWLLFGKPQGRDAKRLAVNASNARLKTQGIGLPAFDAMTEIGADGMWQNMILEDASKKVRIELQPKGETVQIELRAEAFAALFASSFPLEKISARGTVKRDEMMLTEFRGILHDGDIKGNARLKWGANWSLAGEVSARQLSTATWAPRLLEGGRVEGNAKYVLQASTANLLFSAPRVRGNFEIRNGTVLGLELVSLLRSFNPGGKSSFSEVSGGFAYEGGRIQLRDVRLRAGLISANGNADVDADNKLNGHFKVDLKAPTRQARANLTVSGTLKEPRFAP